MKLPPVEASARPLLNVWKDGACLWSPPKWHGEGGVAQLLAVSTPLILSFAVQGINMFLDRVLLSWHSMDAFNAALQSGWTYWAFSTIFFGTVTYAGTFVAQYSGAGRDGDVGSAVWQGIYVALISSIFMVGLTPLAGPFFMWVGHEGDLPQLEATYFTILAANAWSSLLMAALSCHWTGRGKTRFTLVVTAFVCYTNFVLNTWLIFEPPAPFTDGIAGAAWATVLSNVVGIAIYSFFLFRKSEDARFCTIRGWRLHPERFGRLVRFGAPAGIQHFVEMSAFTTFMLAIGKWGADAQFVSNVAMNINLLLFIPAVGLHSGCSILAGQFAGAKQHRMAELTTSAALVVAMVYTVIVCFCYLAIPGFFIGWFRGNIDPDEWERLANIARVLLIFVAYYSLFDALGLVFSGCLKGAGDTRFVMLMAIVTSQVFLTIPAIVLVNYRDAFDMLTGIYIMWGFCSLFITIQAGVFVLRYLAGRWKHMRVIEDTQIMAVIAEENARTEAPEIMPAGH